MPSSSATTPKRAGLRCARPSRCSATSPASSTAVSRAIVAAGQRSAIASSTTPPSASASAPRSATGRPARSVAARSSPPIRRASGMPAGRRRKGCSPGRSARSCVSQASRRSPAAARSAMPPVPTGSTANSCAALRASAQRALPSSLAAFGAGILSCRRPARSHARRASSSRHRRADCGAGDGAAPVQRSCADAHR